jgi:signal transduction histidine kinase
MITIAADIVGVDGIAVRQRLAAQPNEQLRILDFSCRVVSTQEEFSRSLRIFSPDVIIAEYSLPGFSAVAALRSLRRRRHEIPFILVTGDRSEDAAIECIREGADDYILRGSFTRLPSAISGVLTKMEAERRKRAAEEQLSTSKEQLRALSAHLQMIREEERALIAREIHDELGQTLTGIRMDIAWLQQQVSKRRPPEPHAVVGSLESLSRSVDSAIGAVRRIATELRPKILDDLGLIPALEWQLEEFGRRSGISCRFRTNIREFATDQERSTACFRILQESLTNVARHANATEVTVRIRRLDDSMTLEITDNGRGITDEEISNVNSLGLLGMKERAFLLGGSVTVTHGGRRGTTVRVELPV